METWICQDCDKCWIRKTKDSTECPKCGSKNTKCIDIAF